MLAEVDDEIGPLRRRDFKIGERDRGGQQSLIGPDLVKGTSFLLADAFSTNDKL